MRVVSESADGAEDAQRTIRWLRLHAAQYQIDPHKIGVLGFSASGHLVADISTHFDKRLYPAVDAADRVSCDTFGCPSLIETWLHAIGIGSISVVEGGF